MEFQIQNEGLLNLEKLKKCKNCDLYLNQLPIYDDTKYASVFWVGLSAVQFSEDELKLPLSPITRSGALIYRIEKEFEEELFFYKTNMVKCLPLSKDKIRYPIKNEMDRCYPNFIDELTHLKPKMVFLLGKQVAKYVLSKYSIKNFNLCDDYSYDTIKIEETTYIPIHHPSYILVYKRKYIENYIKGIHKLINNLVQKTTQNVTH